MSFLTTEDPVFRYKQMPRSSKMSKSKIRNPATGNYVKRSSSVGKAVAACKNVYAPSPVSLTMRSPKSSTFRMSNPLMRRRSASKKRMSTGSAQARRRALMQYRSRRA